MKRWSPTPKVTAGAVGGALATLIALYLPEFGVQAKPGAEAAFGTLATLVFAYFMKDKP